jgi:hypothetical protein
VVSNDDVPDAHGLVVAGGGEPRRPVVLISDGRAGSGGGMSCSSCVRHQHMAMGDAVGKGTSAARGTATRRPRFRYTSSLATRILAVVVALLAVVALGACTHVPDQIDEPWPPTDAASCLAHRHPMALLNVGSRLATQSTYTLVSGRSVTLYFCFFREGSAELAAHLTVTAQGIVASARPEREDIPGFANEGFVIPVSVVVGSGDGVGGVVVQVTYPPGTSTPMGSGVQISAKGDQMLIVELRRDRPAPTL